MDESLNVSIIIVSFNSDKALATLLPSIDENAEIIIVNNSQKTLSDELKKIGNEKKCLTFRWSKAKLDGHIVDDNSYTYCPKKGFTKMVSHKTNTFKMKVSGDIKGTGTK